MNTTLPHPTSAVPTPRRRARRLVAVVAGLAAASVALSGCLYSLIPDSRPSSTASLAPDTEGVAAELLPFYEQSLIVVHVRRARVHDGHRAARLGRPRCRRDRALRHPPAGDCRATPTGSLLTNPGGPGASGVGLIRDSLDFAVGVGRFRTVTT